MNKLLSVVFIILQSAFLANCKGCHEAPPRTYTEENISEWPPKIEVDTIVEAKQEVEEKEVPKAEEKSSTSASHSSSSSRRSKSPKYDNMRGFDPASEDDMDDNGMSRYMENYDEEGWD